MIYLIINLYINNGIKNLDLRDKNKEIIKVRVSDQTSYQVGDYVLVEQVNKKPQIDTVVSKPDDFLEYYVHGQKNKFQLVEEINYYVAHINDDTLKLLVHELAIDNDLYFLYPAAKTIHHAYLGGLADHSLGMLAIAESYSKLYDLNVSVLYTAIILHDVGKLRELQDFGLTYTVEGNMIGHLIIGFEEVVKVLEKYQIKQTDNIMHLKHLILSHHGRMDYGSPKEPMTVEAYILSQIDETDSKMNLLEKIKQETPLGEISKPVNGFDRRRFLNIK